MTEETKVFLAIGLSCGLLFTLLGRPASWYLLKHYARKVKLITGQVPGWHQPRHRDGVARRAESGPHEEPPPNRLEARARRLARGNAWVYLVASLAFIVAATVLMSWWTWKRQPDLYPVLLVALWIGFPVIFTARLLWAPSRFLYASLTAFYIIALVVLVKTQGSPLGEPNFWFDAAVFVLLLLLPPLILLLGGASRTLRGVFWFVAPICTVLGVGLSLIFLLFAEVQAGVVVFVSASMMATCIAFVAAIWLSYRARLIGDQGVAICLLWFYQAFFLCTLGVFKEWWHAYLGIGLFLVFSVALAVGYGILGRRNGGLPAHHLLLLRSFAPRCHRRNIRLLRDVDLYWRHLGGIVLIGGADLAAETLEPDELLDWLRGRLPHRVITSIRDIEGHLSQLDLRPDADGRYRVYDLVCDTETWQRTFEAVIRRVSVVLIDLRGFTDADSGLGWEVRHVRDVGAKAVVLTDATSDEQLVAELLADHPSWNVLPIDRIDGFRVPHARRVLRALSAAVASGAEPGTADQALPQAALPTRARPLSPTPLEKA